MQKIHFPQGNRETKVVLVGGCFDILHWGHISFLKKAKSLGDYLVVALESDENTKKLKGPNRPIHNQNIRRAILKSLQFVDKVIALSPSPNYELLTKNVKPAIIAATAGDPMHQKKKTLAKKIGAKVVIIPKVKTPSTTQIAKLLSREQN